MEDKFSLIFLKRCLRTILKVSTQRIRGNFGSYNIQPNNAGISQGLGIQQNNNVAGYVSVQGDQNNPGIILGTSLFSFKIDQGLWFQASGCDIDVFYTLEPWNYAASNEANANKLVHWCNRVSVPKDTIIESEIRGFSAAKVVFKGPGILYALAR